MEDVEISRHGSIFLFALRTESAQQWVDENVGGDATWFGDQLAVEGRYAVDLAGGMLGDGLQVI
jgi:hypothetical protein